MNDPPRKAERAGLGPLQREYQRRDIAWRRALCRPASASADRRLKAAHGAFVEIHHRLQRAARALGVTAVPHGLVWSKYSWTVQASARLGPVVRRTTPRRAPRGLRRHRRAARTLQRASGDDSGPEPPPPVKTVLLVACAAEALGFAAGLLAAAVAP